MFITCIVVGPLPLAVGVLPWEIYIVGYLSHVHLQVCSLSVMGMSVYQGVLPSLVLEQIHELANLH